MGTNESYYSFDEKGDILVFDAGPLISGTDINMLKEQCFTTAEVFDEVENEYYKEKAITGGNLKFIVVPEKFSKQIKRFASESGDISSLSENDIGILGLSLYLRQSFAIQFGVENESVPIKLVTDDYTIQNVARFVGIKTHAYKETGISNSIKWEIYCPLCYEIYPSSYFGKNCPNCGEKIKRRPMKKKTGSKKRRK